MLLRSLLSLTLLAGLTPLPAADWPMWRSDPGHTAVSEERLSDSLHLQWVRTFSPRKRVWDDPLNHDLMQYDKLLEPIILGDLVIAGFSENDRVAAFDLGSGEERWAFHADGPVRLAPVGWRGRVYFCSDDGYLYCLNAADGSLLWKFRGAPDDRKALGNERVISAWPARGGPVIRDGTLYFAASIWPFMGTFIYALDARTGEVEWVNDGTGADYIKQPHSAPSFAGVAPQGILVALEDHLLVPGGRSVPAAFDRRTGALLHFHLNDGGKANGGSFVIGAGDRFYVHTRLRGVRAYETDSGKKTGFVVNEPVLTENLLYTAAAEPDLKVRLQAAAKAAGDADSAWSKAVKQLEAAQAAKAKPLDEPLAGRDQADENLREAQQTLSELKTQLEPDDPVLAEAKKTAEEAKKALDAAEKKLADAKKVRREPVDGKLYDEVAKREGELCEKDLAHLDLLRTWETTGRDVRVLQAYDAKDKLQWEFEADGLGDLIMAGGTLYAAGTDTLVAVADPGVPERARIAWQTPVDGAVERLLAGNGKLIAVTLDGRILCYGEERVSDPRRPVSEVAASREWPFSRPQDNRRARQVLARADVDEGYALCFGVGDGRMLEALTEESRLHVVAVDPDKRTVDGLRAKFEYMDLYGERIVLQQGDPETYQAPPYMFSLVILGEAMADRLRDPATLRLIYESVRPYGGALWFPPNSGLLERIGSLDLPQAEIVPGPEGSTFVFRQGPLPEAADWTHQYGNMANTVKSDDKRVKLPLGILWFGGSPNTDVLPRHGHGPSEQVIGGRTLIEGMNRLSARDVYTGRILWKRDFENLGTYGIYYDSTYKDDPLNPAYNQVHIPGANARGTNYVATEDEVYVAIGSACHVLDAASGQDIGIIEMPAGEVNGRRPAWGYIGIEGDLLFAGNDFAHYTSRYGLNEKKPKEGDKTASTSGRKGRKRKKQAEPQKAEVPAIEDLSASAGLIAFDRHTGELIWQVDAEFSFLHNGIISGGGKLYLLDKFPKSMEEKLKRRGLAEPEDYRILAIDASTGETLWEHRGGIFGTWLAYSAKHDVLLEAGAEGRDRLKDEVGEGMTAYRAGDGHVIWKKEKLAYAGPCILHNDIILTAPDQYSDSSGAYHLTDGSPYMVTNPLTGNKEPWRITRAYGCNHPIAGEHLLTFRSGAAGYYDLANMSGTGNFGGFKSGCTSNLIPANGVLNAPDYTRTCSCGYQNQTSLALVHMPDVELWTYNRYGADAESHEEVSRVGINFGAPGDRRAEDGTLWLEWPEVGGASPVVRVEVEPEDGHEATPFRRHTSRVLTTGTRGWVGASGIRHARKITVRPTMRYQAPGNADTLTLAIDASAGDAEEAPDGEVRLTSSDLELVRDEGDQVVGLRFADVPLFPGETIKHVSLRFTVDEPDAGKETELEISLEDAVNARPFEERPHDLSSRQRLTRDKPVVWKPKSWKKAGDHGGDQHSPELAPLLQELVNRPDWEFGNAVAFLISSLKGEGQRVAESFDGDPKAAPRLHIEVDGPRPRIRVAAKEDDAEERADQTVSLDSSDLELCEDSENGGPQLVGLRFRDIQIPRGQRLASAHIAFTVDEMSAGPAHLHIQVEDHVDPPAFKNEPGNLSKRKTLDGEVSWNPETWDVAGRERAAQRTPDLAPLLQELVDREDWAPGQAICFLIRGQGTRTAASFDGKKEWAPKLVVDFVPDEAHEADENSPRFTVKLHYFDPDGLPAGERVGEIWLQGDCLLRDFDIAAERTPHDAIVVKTFTGIPIAQELELEWRPSEGTTEAPVISGIELIREPDMPSGLAPTTATGG